MAKAGPPAPIDRPLASAYLRGFDGWSTAYPPELSQPSTLRKMENMYVTPESALRIRPGLRSAFQEDYWVTGDNYVIVGGYEHFMATDTLKGILLAVRDVELNEIEFRTFIENPITARFDPIVGLIPGLEDVRYPGRITFIKYLQIDNKILVLPNDPTAGTVLVYAGADKSVKVVPIEGLTRPNFDEPDKLQVVHPDAAWIGGSQITIPTAETPISGETGTLISATDSENQWTFGYYYTIETEFGESAASDMVMLRAQRGWSQWRMYIPTANGSQGTTLTPNPSKAMDQLVAIMPQAVYNSVLDLKPLRWNLYMVTWSDTTAIPSTGLLVGSKSFTGDMNKDRWITHNPAATPESYLTPIPSLENRENFSGAPTATQGLVAGDRVILVNDARARITWSANLPQEYTNFSPVKGGGRKTLSAGNLQVPINVQLWQNPQATDTITVLCAGLDGYHSAYYMAPAAVSGQSDSTIIMGFEETTATPGTVSPYGVEVFNNALYHPLEDSLMKSTAANYVISHKTMTEDIANMWRRLINKKNIVSSYLGDYLYYLVHNPAGDPLEPGCLGNEIWVMAPSKEGAIWSRWKIQGIALRRMELGDYLYMTVVTPSAVFLLDPQTYADERPTAEGTTESRGISWKWETNSLGANTRRDVQVMMQNARLHFGDWVGKMKWGIRAWDGHGRQIDMNKIFQGVQDGIELPVPDHRIDPLFDLGDTSDVLQLRTPLQEWTLYGESLEDEEGNPVLAYGQMNMARFMFTQQSVNAGYNEGVIQSFEYQRNIASGNDSITQNGIPRPIQDTRRP